LPEKIWESRWRLQAAADCPETTSREWNIPRAFESFGSVAYRFDENIYWNVFTVEEGNDAEQLSRISACLCGPLF
jgi:hypothetical protein